MIVLHPYIPLALWFPLAASALGLLGWYAVAARSRLPRGRWLGVLVLMTIAIGIPLAILLNPTWVERVPPPAGKPLLTILVDRTVSMGTADAGEGKTRYQAGCQIAANMARQLEDRYEVRVQTFAAETAIATPETMGRAVPDGPVTDLARAIEGGLGEDRPQGQAMLLLSDGIHTAGGGTRRVRNSAEKAKAMAVPLYVKTLGGETTVNDLHVELGLSQELAFVGQRISVIVRVKQSGSLALETGLSLLLDGEVVERREVELATDGTTETVFHITQNTAGLYRYEIRAEPLPAEVTDVNNTATLLVRVVDQPVRVLLLEGKPYWDTKFLIRTLVADQSIELVSVVRMAEGRLLQRTISRSAPAATKTNEPEDGGGEAEDAETTPAKPAPPKNASPRSEQWAIEKDAGQILSKEGSLASYQIVVLGRNAEVFLGDPALVQLKKWLRSGDGSLVCFRGSPSSQVGQRLGELLPVRWSPTRESRFRVRMTESGQAMRWLPSSPDRSEDVLAALPSLAMVHRPENPRTLARVLATSISDDASHRVPVITYRPEGNGRVVVVEGAGMWRWAFLPPDHQQHDETYGLLWRSLIRWLVANVGLLPSQRLSLRADEVTFRNTDSATASLLLREDQLDEDVPQIELSGESLASPRTITPVLQGSTPGLFRVPFGRLPEGRYSARVVDAKDDEVFAVAVFDVRGNLKERLEVAANSGAMEDISRLSGGAVLSGNDPQQLAEQFDEHLSKSRPERTMRTTAWDRWWVLAAVFTLWGATWGLRRWSGLV